MSIGQPDHDEKKAYQKEQYDIVYSCFEEIKRILEAIKYLFPFIFF